MFGLVLNKYLFPAYVSILFFGYLLASSFSLLLFDDPDNSTLSILYRFSVIILSPVFILKNLHDGLVTRKLILCLGSFFIFWLLYSGRIFYDVAFQFDALGGDFFRKYILFGYGVTFIPSLCLMRNYSVRDIERIVKASFIILFIGCILSFYLSVTNLNSAEESLSRLYNDKLNPISLGHYSLNLFLVTFCIFKFRDELNSKVAIFTIIFSIVSIFVAGSRGAVLSLIPCAFLIFFDFVDRRRLVNYLLMGFVLLFAVNLVVQYLFPENNFYSKFTSLGSSTDASAQIRYRLYYGAWNQFSTNPIFGDLLEERVFRYYPHNIFLEILMAVGVVGFVTFLLLLIQVIHRWLIYKRKFIQCSEYVFGFTLYLLFIQNFIGVQFSHSLASASQLWYIIILLVSYISTRVYERK